MPHGISLTYKSSWEKAFVHYKADDGQWTTPPGRALAKLNGEHKHELKVDASKLEFVCTNGAGQWDKAPHGGNYIIDSPGHYELAHGRVGAVASSAVPAATATAQTTAAPTSTEVAVAQEAVVPRPEAPPAAALVAPGAAVPSGDEHPAQADANIESSASMFRKNSLTVLGPPEGEMVRKGSQAMLARKGSRYLADGGGIRLTYHSAWQEAYLHGSIDGGSWTELPGLPWTKNAGGIWALQLDAQRIEFVNNNGAGAWDKASNGGNYVVDAPGEYVVRGGIVKKSVPPPRPPQLVVVQGVGNASLELAWNPPDNEEGIVGYRVYTNDDKTSVVEVPATQRSCTVTGLKGALTYTMTVTSLNEDGLESAGTGVEATTSTPGKPSPPAFLQVTSHDESHIALSWAPPRDIGGASVTAYHVFRNGVAVDTVIGRDTETGEDLQLLSWQDTKVEEGATYSYAVSAMHFPERTPSRTDLLEVLERRASRSLMEVQPDDNEGPPCEEVTGSAVPMLQMPRLGERKTHVILQGFNWWSCDNKNGWYNVLKEKVPEFQEAGFDMVWLPPPAQCADRRGYLPSKWYDLKSYYGTHEELLALTKALHKARICPVLDLVVNHRCASKKDNRGKWTVFEQPDWEAWAICRNDQSGTGEGGMSTGELIAYAPDIDHTNPKVQKDVNEWVAWMFKEIGFRALRLDFVIGFAPRLQEQYVRAAGSPFAVAEYWHGDPVVLRNYVNATKGQVAVFDFPVYYTLKDCVRNDNFCGLNWEGKPPGIMGSDPVRSCTFVENHDTDHLEIVGGPFGNNEQIVRGYVYILTHPGTPTVFWSDWSDRGSEVKQHLSRCAQLRREAGVHCLSRCNIVASEGGLYAAYIDGDKGALAMKLGSRGWSPNGNWRKALAGNGFCVWIRQ